MVIIGSSFGLNYQKGALLLESYKYEQIAEFKNIRLAPFLIEAESLEINIVDAANQKNPKQKDIENKNTKNTISKELDFYELYLKVKTFFRKVKIDNVEINYQDDYKINFTDFVFTKNINLNNLYINDSKFLDSVSSRDLVVSSDSIQFLLDFTRDKNKFLSSDIKLDKNIYSAKYNLNKIKISKLKKILPPKLLPKSANEYLSKINSGTLRASGLIKGSSKEKTTKEVKINTNLKISSVSTKLNDVLISSASLSYAGEVFPRINNSADVFIKKISASVDLSDVKSKIHYKNKALKLSNIEAGVFKGKVFIPYFQITKNGNFKNFTLIGKDLSLDEISKLYSKGYKVSGKFDFSAPMNIHADQDSSLKFSSDNGVFNGHYGDIKISDKRLDLIEQPSVKKVYTLLKDFNYNRLGGTFSYSKNGDLKVLAHLFGRSLNVERPIDFNLNFEDNIPMLLKSIQLSKGKFN